MRKTRTFFFAGLAIAASAVGGFAYSDANASQSKLSAIQLETIEALTDPETAPVTDCPNPAETECHRILQGNTIHIFYMPKS